MSAESLGEFVTLPLLPCAHRLPFSNLKRDTPNTPFPPPYPPSTPSLPFIQKRPSFLVFSNDPPPQPSLSSVLIHTVLIFLYSVSSPHPLVSSVQHDRRLFATTPAHVTLTYEVRGPFDSTVLVFILFAFFIYFIYLHLHLPLSPMPLKPTLVSQSRIFTFFQTTYTPVASICCPRPPHATDRPAPVFHSPFSESSSPSISASPSLALPSSLNSWLTVTICD